VLKRCVFRARRKAACESVSLMLTGRLFQMSGAQTEQARRPNGVLVGRTTADLACWTQAQKSPGSNRSRDAVG